MIAVLVLEDGRGQVCSAGPLSGGSFASGSVATLGCLESTLLHLQVFVDESHDEGSAKTLGNVIIGQGQGFTTEVMKMGEVLMPTAADFMAVYILSLAEPSILPEATASAYLAETVQYCCVSLA
jgi:hypothetical protein